MLTHRLRCVGETIAYCTLHITEEKTVTTRKDEEAGRQRLVIAAGCIRLTGMRMRRQGGRGLAAGCIRLTGQVALVVAVSRLTTRLTCMG